MLDFLVSAVKKNRFLSALKVPLADVKPGMPISHYSRMFGEDLTAVTVSEVKNQHLSK